MGQKPRIHSHPDEKTEIYEGAQRVAAGLVMRGRPLLSGPLAVGMFTFLPIPASFSKRNRLDAIERCLRPTANPD
ncbi:RusA family crossover junction endodeoxyribonuclease [Methylorubrum extorquens]